METLTEVTLPPPISRVGNQVPRYSGWKPLIIQDTLFLCKVGNQVPRYSGWKPFVHYDPDYISVAVGNQVPRYSGWKRCQAVAPHHLGGGLETKYRDIADGNPSEVMETVFASMLETKYRDIAD